MAKRHILVVEDERDVADLIKHAIERIGEADVQIVGSGDSALRAVSERPPDLVLLDVNLPVLDGLEVCRIMKSRHETRHVPIIMVTARGEEDDKVKGLETGADDYISKPFSLRELTARVRAVLRRGNPIGDAAAHVYRGEHLTVDFEAISVSVDDKPVRLTRREFELLSFLVQNKDRVISRDRLLERVWGFDRLVETRSVDVHIGRLRNKLGSAGRQVETIIGLGYRFIG